MTDEKMDMVRAIPGVSNVELSQTETDTLNVVLGEALHTPQSTASVAMAIAKQFPSCPVKYGVPNFMGTTEALYSFVPLPGMLLTEQLNALFRFSIYYGIAVCIFCASPKALLIPVLTGALTAAVHRFDVGQRTNTIEMMRNEGLERDPETARLCRAPTKDNPFMNPAIGDMGAVLVGGTRPPCDITRPSVRKRVDKLFHGDKWQEPHDVFKRNSGFRQFYTVAAPNDQGAFANWLFNDRSISYSRKTQ
eukprot:gene32074-biopygen9549